MLNGKIKKNISFTSLFFIILLILSSCKPVTFVQLQTDISLPADADYFDGESIYVSFNYPVQKEVVESLITIEEKSTSVDLSFDWESDSKVRVTPLKGWKSGRTYSMKVQGRVCTVRDGDFDVDEIRYFSYGVFEGQLVLEKYPKVLLDSNVKRLEFKFNKPVVQSTVIDSINFTPFFENSITFSEDNSTVYVTPKDEWMINTIVEWKIADNVKSADGFFLNKGYGGELKTLEDKVLPKLEKLCPAIDNNGKYIVLDSNLDGKIKDKQAIAFIFSKPMDLSSVEKSIQFAPSLVGKFSMLDDEKKTVIFQPYSRYEIGKEYHITVGSECSDLKKLQLYEEQDFFFKTENKFLTIEKLIANGVTAIENGISKTDSNGYITVMGAGSNPTVDSLVTFEIYFSANISDKYRAESAVSSAAIFPSALSSPTKVSVVFDNNVMTIKYKGFKASNTEKHCYELNIGGTQRGVLSANEDYMEDDVCIKLIVKEPDGQPAP